MTKQELKIILNLIEASASKELKTWGMTNTNALKNRIIDIFGNPYEEDKFNELEVSENSKGQGVGQRTSEITV